MSRFKNKFLLAIVFAVLVIGCNENRIYETHKSGFTNYRWDKTNVVEFKPQISNVEENYMVYVAIRHVYGFQLKSVKVRVEIKSPSGKTSSKLYELKVFKNSNEYISDCAGDYCDLEVLVEKDFKFEEPGEYVFSISHEMDVDPVPNLMQIGLIIDKK